MCLQELNKIDAYTQTKVDPQELSTVYKKRFLVSFRAQLQENRTASFFTCAVLKKVLNF